VSAAPLRLLCNIGKRGPSVEPKSIARLRSVEPEAADCAVDAEFKPQRAVKKRPGDLQEVTRPKNWHGA
jgi:hypothetical protein